MEQMLIVWLQTHIATVATWIVSIGAVGIAIKKYGPKIRRFVKIGRESMDIIDTLLDALQDDKITDDEIKNIIEEVNHFKDVIK
jgi:hypothetical protein